MLQEPTDSDAKGDVLKRVTQFTALLVFYLYFAGWMYTNQIFLDFGLSLNVIDEPAYFLIVYAYRVFFDNWMGTSAFVLLTALGYFLAVTKVRWLELLLVVFLVVVPFPTISWLATRAADRRAAEIRSGKAVPISFTFRSEARNRYPIDIAQRLEQSENLYVFAQTVKTYYVIYQPPPEAGSTELPRAYTYDVKAEDVIAVKRLVNVKEIP